MTNPVVLLGTQSNGETLPVQVDAFGRLVAEGLPGPPGPPGEEGPPGPGGEIELPPNAYEGAVLGWQGGELAWLDPITGLPLPIGSEGQIIQVVNSDPVWVTNNQVPPFTPNQIELYTGTYSGDQKKGMFAPDGTIPQGVDNWDAYARAQPFWENLQETPAGACHKDSLTASFEFTLSNENGYVIELGIAGAFYVPSNYAEITFSVTTEEANLIPIAPNVTWLNNKPAQTNGGSGNVSFLANRPNLGPVTFTVTASSPAVVYGPNNFIGFQSWKAVDPGTFAVQQQIQVSKKLDAIADAFKALYEVGSTTDIDLLRTSQD